METKIDLHIHTNKSDGNLSPKKIIDEAVKNQVNVIAICDHDTTAAYTDEIYNYALKNNIQLINGIEISTKTDKAGIHILGYNIDINNEDLQNKLNALQNARHNYLYNVSEKLENLGYLVNKEELDKIDTVTKAHIANDILNNPLNHQILLENFKHIPNKGEFIETIMNEGCVAFVKKESITPKEASILIHNAGGKVILAHPVAYKYENHLTEKDILSLIKDINADGIEAYYIYIDKFNNVIDETIYWNQFAKNHNLITTIGSDFHNKDNLHPEIGLSNYNIKIDKATINIILNNLNNK